jgi:hypothetical protein
MKRVFSIFIVSLFLISGMHVTIATHFCGGVVAATKISLSGELASCGMESVENSYPLPGNYLSSNCCDDEVSVYAVDNNYTPSFSVIKEFSQNILQVFYIPVNFSICSLTAFNSLHTSAGPPGEQLASAVSMADICVFRI